MPKYSFTVSKGENGLSYLLEDEDSSDSSFETDANTGVSEEVFTAELLRIESMHYLQLVGIALLFGAVLALASMRFLRSNT